MSNGNPDIERAFETFRVRILEIFSGTEDESFNTLYNQVIIPCQGEWSQDETGIEFKSVEGQIRLMQFNWTYDCDQLLPGRIHYELATLLNRIEGTAPNLIQGVSSMIFRIENLSRQGPFGILAEFTFRGISRP